MFNITANFEFENWKSLFEKNQTHENQFLSSLAFYADSLIHYGRAHIKY